MKILLTFYTCIGSRQPHGVNSTVLPRNKKKTVIVLLKTGIGWIPDMETVMTWDKYELLSPSDRWRTMRFIDKLDNRCKWSSMNVQLLFGLSFYDALVIFEPSQMFNVHTAYAHIQSVNFQTCFQLLKWYKTTWKYFSSYLVILLAVSHVTVQFVFCTRNTTCDSISTIHY